MHELSIAYSLVETAAAAARKNHIAQVDAVHLRLGVMSGVVKEALLFGYDIATENTPLAGSRLEIEEIPVMVMCPQCQSVQTLSEITLLVCPVCHTPTGKIIQGKEIEIVSITYYDEPAIA
ncbi:MAG: hydrogenase maturation nickel metallochaperone HypA [Candidatus Promineifilaceae bacterium]